MGGSQLTQKLALTHSSIEYFRSRVSRVARLRCCFHRLSDLLAQELQRLALENGKAPAVLELDRVRTLAKDRARMTLDQRVMTRLSRFQVSVVMDEPTRSPMLNW